MANKMTLNLLAPVRLRASHLFILFSGLIFFAIVSIISFIKIYFSLVGQIKEKEAISIRYQELSNRIILPDNADVKLNSFRNGLERLKNLEIDDVGIGSVLNELEKGKADGVRYIKIEYNSMGNKCVLEFSAIDSSHASQLLKKLESVSLFKSVTILQRDRTGDIDKYSIEIRI